MHCQYKSCIDKNILVKLKFHNLKVPGSIGVTAVTKNFCICILIHKKDVLKAIDNNWN